MDNVRDQYLMEKPVGARTVKHRPGHLAAGPKVMPGSESNPETTGRIRP